MKQFKILLTSMLLMGSIYAATFNVSTTAEFRQALSDAAGNVEDDTIILSDGIYKTTDDGRGTFKYDGTSSYLLHLVGSSHLNVILDGDNVNQVIEHYSSGTSKIILDNISIINGVSQTYGGGIYTYETIEINDCNISNNRAEENLGGGIMARGYSNKITNSIISNNFAGDGSGGIHFSRTGEVSNSVISHNSSPSSAEGGVGITAGDALTIYDSNISYNEGALSGAAVKLYDYNLVIEDSIITYNISGGTGEVISAQSMKIKNTLIVNNTPSTILAPPTIPTDVTASDGTIEFAVGVSWTGVANVNHYNVYRSKSQADTGEIVGVTTGTSFVDDTVEENTKYYYRVNACNDEGCSDYSDADSGYIGQVSTPINPAIIMYLLN